MPSWWHFGCQNPGCLRTVVDDQLPGLPADSKYCRRCSRSFVEEKIKANAWSEPRRRVTMGAIGMVVQSPGKVRINVALVLTCRASESRATRPHSLISYQRA